MKDLFLQLLPIICVIAIWLYIMFKIKKGNPASKQNEVLDVLKEIRDELKELNKNNSEKKL